MEAGLLEWIYLLFQASSWSLPFALPIIAVCMYRLIHSEELKELTEKAEKEKIVQRVEKVRVRLRGTLIKEAGSSYIKFLNEWIAGGVKTTQIRILDETSLKKFEEALLKGNIEVEEELIVSIERLLTALRFCEDLEKGLPYLREARWRIRKLGITAIIITPLVAFLINPFLKPPDLNAIISLFTIGGILALFLYDYLLPKPREMIKIKTHINEILNKTDEGVLSYVLSQVE